MISAIQNNGVNQTSFASIVPVRVKIDGRETYNEAFIRPACRQLANVLTGPTKEKDTAKIDIIRYFGKFDPEYNVRNGIYGHQKAWNQKKALPSDYFRCICDNKIGNFFVTGVQAKIIKKLGKEVGLEKQACKSRGESESLDLNVALENYWRTIKNYIKNKKIRLTESYNPNNEEKIGEPVTLVINMKSNQKYGQSNFKMKLDNIVFEKSNT